MDSHHLGKREEVEEFLRDLPVKLRRRRRRRWRRRKKGGCCHYYSNPIELLSLLLSRMQTFFSWENITLPNISMIISVSVSVICF